KALLREMNYDNIYVKHGDGYKGWPGEAPFDKIIVTAAPEKVPEALKEQLKPGGKMVLPVGDRFQLLKVIRKSASGKISEKTITGVRFVPMIHTDN
ncbi:MAG: protein-L-isoaspartate O-methyltransferase family protein, partial [Bacteroidota bacterium]